jgi:hypothetical protein
VAKSVYCSLLGRRTLDSRKKRKFRTKNIVKTDSINKGSAPGEKKSTKACRSTQTFLGQRRICKGN